MSGAANVPSTGILIEAESFTDWGGWSLDSQFTDQMGSSYLIAHGLGEPVEDATTNVDIPAGTYTVFVRTKDWVAGYHPGTFQVSFNSAPLPTAFGADDKDWHWENAGTVELPGGVTHIALHDLTGFDGRCDALYLSADGSVPPEDGLAVDRSWRKRMLGLPEEPRNRGTFDVVVVGGGVGGCAAAISAARQGLTVALLSDRPVLGGNASSEVGLGPRGYTTPFVNELIARKDNGNLGATQLVETEQNITYLPNEHMFAANMDGNRIVSVVTRNTLSSAESVFVADTFIDASGLGALARAAGADIRTGREPKSEFNESYAPDEPDQMHHGNTLLFHLTMEDHPVTCYNDIPWATAVSKDFSCLAGQMDGLSKDNYPGPCAHEPDPKQMEELSKKAEQVLGEMWVKNHGWSGEEVMAYFPATHYWEYGQYLNLYEGNNEEEVRDHLLRALYGTMSNIKNAQPEKYANLQFAWIHLVPARGEYCRIMGDYILTENDVLDHKHFDDAIVMNGDPFCLHWWGNDEYDFRLKGWTYDDRDGKPYAIPFRCLYSRNIDNLMMAGKHISVSRVVSSSAKVMANGANDGVACGTAAALCKKYGTTPREVGAAHFDELKHLVDQMQLG